MGITPGAISEYPVNPDTNYRRGPAAYIGGTPGIGTDGKPTRIRKTTFHMFPGPDHSVVHPGIYPHNDQAVRHESEPEGSGGLATIREWLTYDHEAGWGTEAFERAERDRRRDDQGTEFPERWRTRASRMAARRILDDQFALLEEYDAKRVEVLRNGYQLGDIEIEKADKRGIRFKVEVKNATEGHSVPTGFIGDRIVFLQVEVTDRDGAVIYRSGDLDPNGDLRDRHSEYVHDRELPLDRDLFSLQSKFLTRNVRGSEREEVLAVNTSQSPLPFLRPSTLATTLLGRPQNVRLHKNNIPAGSSRWAKYRIKGSALTKRGPYRASIKLIVGMVPINLINEIKVVGFQYGMSAREVAEGVLKGHRILWEREFDINAP